MRRRATLISGRCGTRSNRSCTSSQVHVDINVGRQILYRVGVWVYTTSSHHHATLTSRHATSHHIKPHHATPTHTNLRSRHEGEEWTSSMTKAFDLQPDGVAPLFWDFVVVTVARNYHYHHARPVQSNHTQPGLNPMDSNLNIASYIRSHT